jgi:two-component system cell cycle sensor histidine kinase PleC
VPPPRDGSGPATLPALAVLERLQVPVWVFDIDRRAMVWANAEAVRLWGAESRAALLAHDWASGMSATTATRLKGYVARFMEGGTVSESWTFYPRGLDPLTARCVCSGITLADGRLAMLVEAERIAGDAFPSEDVRGLEAVRHTTVKIAMFDLAGERIFENPAAQAGLPRARRDEKPFPAYFAERSKGRSVWRHIMSEGAISGEARIGRGRDAVWHAVHGVRTIDPLTGTPAVLVNLVDIDRARWSETVLAASARVLEEIAANRPLPDVLDTIARMAEEAESGLHCSILLLEPETGCLRHGAGPSLPETYIAAVDGVRIGEAVGSCGHAAFSRERVVVENIATHPYWTGFREVALAAGLRACWSEPIVDAGGAVLGTFGTYYREARRPSRRHLDVIAGALRLARLAIERNREYQALIEARQKAEVANAAKSRFLAGVSHELRTPLNAIIGFADILSQKIIPLDDDRYADYAGDIKSSGSHLLGIINEVLDLSRIEAGRAEFNLVPQGPGPIIDDAVRFLQPRARRDGVTLRNDRAPDLPAILADAQRLRQVLLNLINNAVQAVPSGGTVRVCAGLDPAIDGKPPGLWIAVADNGIGMSAAQIDKAFEPFVQVHSGARKKADGAGLGLTIVKQFVEWHGGTIAIASEPDRGTTVTVTLPLADPA